MRWEVFEQAVRVLYPLIKQGKNGLNLIQRRKDPISMQKAIKSFLFIFCFSSSLLAHAQGSLPSVLDLLLSEKGVQLFEDNFLDDTGWEFTTNAGSDPESDDYAGAGITGNVLSVSASQDCGSASANAIKVIDEPFEIDNIKWTVNFDYLYFDNGSGSVRLNFGGINIYVRLNEFTIPFRVWDGLENAVLIVEYKQGNLSAKINGTNLNPTSLTSVAITADISSSVRAGVSAGAADCYATASMSIRRIIASTRVED